MHVLTDRLQHVSEPPYVMPLFACQSMADLGFFYSLQKAEPAQVSISSLIPQTAGGPDELHPQSDKSLCKSSQICVPSYEPRNHLLPDLYSASVSDSENYVALK
jgi:hypothetical protein